MLAEPSVIDRLNVETLFNDELVLAAAAQSTWAGRRKVNLAELVDERWILSVPGTWVNSVIADAFRELELKMPKSGLNTLSIHLRANLVATSSCITAFPRSVLDLYGKPFGLKALPVKLPSRPWPVTILTLKGRILSPVAERFIESARGTIRG